MKNHLPYGRHFIDQDDIDAVVKTLSSNFITQGPEIEKFENSIKNICSSKYGFAVNSATAALHISCIALELGPDDIFWTSANTFVSSANCGVHTGAKVDFVDIDPNTFNMSIIALEEKLIKARAINKLPKVVIPVHFAGQPCDMEAIYNLSLEYGFKIIEDASHALGAKYKDINIGSSKFSDITVFSFHPVKMITTGEGGMAMTNSKSIAFKLKKLKSHGILSDKYSFKEVPNDEIWNYQQFDLGFNYRMTDISATLGISQVNKLDTFVKKRRLLAKNYDFHLKNLPLKFQIQPNFSFSSYHLYPIRLCLEKISKTQKQVFSELFNKGIMVNLHYIPVYRQPFYQDLGFKKGYCPEAENYYKEAISIPLYPGMSLDDQKFVINSIEDILI